MPMTHYPRKRFGQNFLHDPAIIRGIVAAIAPRRNQRLVEIGPGLGAITVPLLERVDRLDVIEIDRDLAAILGGPAPERESLVVHNADALKFDFSALAADAQLRVVGNLPYNISTPLIFHLLQHSAHIQDMHFLLQKEVVDRMVAGPGGKDYGRLSVMVQRRCRTERLFEVGPGAFRPPPKVHSAFVRLTPLPASTADLAADQLFAGIVTAAFSQRRKTLRNSLKSWFAASELAALGIDPAERPERLAIRQFERLAQAQAKKVQA